MGRIPILARRRIENLGLRRECDKADLVLRFLCRFPFPVSCILLLLFSFFFRKDRQSRERREGKGDHTHRREIRHDFCRRGSVKGLGGRGGRGREVIRAGARPHVGYQCNARQVHYLYLSHSWRGHKSSVRDWTWEGDLEGIQLVVGNPVTVTGSTWSNGRETP